MGSVLGHDRRRRRMVRDEHQRHGTEELLADDPLGYGKARRERSGKARMNIVAIDAEPLATLRLRWRNDGGRNRRTRGENCRPELTLQGRERRGRRMRANYGLSVR